MTTPILKAAALSADPRRLAGRSMPAPARKEAQPAATATPGVPLLAAAPAAVAALAGTLSRTTIATPTPTPGDAWQRELDAARKKAFETGLAEGRATGREEGLRQGLEEARTQAAREREESAAQLESLLKRLDQRFRDDIAGLEAPVAELVLAACRRILGDAAGDPAAIAAVVRQAVSQARQEEVLSIRMAPHDLALLRDGTGAQLPASWPLRADDSLAPGGCVVEVAGGTLDARLQTQFKALADSIAQAAATHLGTRTLGAERPAP